MLISQQKITPRFTDLLAVFRKQDQIISSKIVQKYIPNQYLYWTGSGREALRQILVDLREENYMVGMPAFTCHVVLDAVKRAGCLPVFYDSGVIANFNDIKKIINQVDILILSYNFGFLPDIKKIVELCKQNKVIIIEDCAQALGATYNDQLAGSFGDYAFYSFGISKNIGFCGGLIGSKKKLLLKKQQLYPLTKLIKVTLEAIISQLFFNKYLYPFTSKLLRKELTKEQESLNYKLPNFAKKIILNQFKRYDQIIEKRRFNANYCIRELTGLISFIQPTLNNNSNQFQDNNSVWLYFTLLVQNKEQLIHKLLKEGIELGEMSTFQCLDEKNKKLYKKAFETKKQHLTFALYRNEKEITSIIQKIKKVLSNQ